jgi:hypothetical protein
MKRIVLPEIPSDVTGGIRQFCENIRLWLREFSSSGINVDIPVYADNAAAIAGGLKAGMFYRTGADPDIIAVVH